MYGLSYNFLSCQCISYHSISYQCQFTDYHTFKFLHVSVLVIIQVLAHISLPVIIQVLTHVSLPVIIQDLINVSLPVIIQVLTHFSLPVIIQGLIHVNLPVSCIIHVFFTHVNVPFIYKFLPMLVYRLLKITYSCRCMSVTMQVLIHISVQTAIASHKFLPVSLCRLSKVLTFISVNVHVPFIRQVLPQVSVPAIIQRPRVYEIIFT